MRQNAAVPASDRVERRRGFAVDRLIGIKAIITKRHEILAKLEAGVIEIVIEELLRRAPAAVRPFWFALYAEYMDRQRTYGDQQPGGDGFRPGRSNHMWEES